jgi:hypothetical protein
MSRLLTRKKGLLQLEAYVLAAAGAFGGMIILQTVFLFCSALLLHGASLPVTCVTLLLEAAGSCSYEPQVAFRKRHVISDDQISALTFHFCNAQHVDLAGCYHLTAKAFANICTTLPQLRTLDVAECRALCDEAVESITRLRRLEVLRLSGLWQLRNFPHHTADADVSAVNGCGRRAMPSLRVLDLAWCSSIPAGRFPGLANAFPQLEELDVRLTQCRDVAVLVPLVHLRRLHLSRPLTPQALADAVLLLGGLLPALEGISMEHPHARVQPEFPMAILPPHLRLLEPRPRRT